jgi:hypothetical protein
MPSWVVEKWNVHESNHSYSSCQATWGLCNNFQNKPCLAHHLILLDRSKCIGPHSSPRHLICLSFILLLMMTICGAQGRIKIKHTFITYIAKPKTGSRRKQFIQSDQDVHVYVYARHDKVYTRPGMGHRYYHTWWNIVVMVRWTLAQSRY